MKFDIQSDSEAVQSFILTTIEQFYREQGKASVIRFDVQAVHGQIHAYPSAYHTPDTIYEDIGKPLNFIFDREPWSEHYYKGDTPAYKDLHFDPDRGDGGYNDFFSVMVHDAVSTALKRVPPEHLPVAVVVESALESGGEFQKLVIPCTSGG